MASSNAPVHQPTSPRWWPGIVLVLGLFATLPFLPSLQQGFINLDDPRFITENPIVTEPGKEQLREAFLKGWGTPYYKPLVYLSWRLDHSLGGGDAFPFHLTNLLLHALNTLLVYLVSLTILRIPGMKKAQLAALLTAALFAWHPMKVESVAWAMQRKDLLYTFFYLVSIWTYLRARQGRAYRYAVASGLAFLLALASKSMAMTLPLVLILLDWMLFPVRWKRSASLLLPVLFAALAGAVAYGIPSRLGIYLSAPMIQTELPALANTLGPPVDPLTLFERLVLTSHRITLWLWHLVWPVGLSLVYPVPSFLSGGEIPGAYFLTLLVPFGIGGVSVWAYFKAGLKWPLGAFLVFLVMLFPVFLQGGHDTTYVSDRFVYLPSLSLLLPLALLPTMMKGKWPGLLASIAVVGLLGTLSYAQARRWDSTESLWEHSLAHYEAIPTAWNNLGLIRHEQGRMQEALEHFGQAIRYNPWLPEYHNNQGSVLAALGRKEAAVGAFTSAVMLDTTYRAAWSNLGLALSESGRPREALEALDKARALLPSDEGVLLNRANVLMGLSDHKGALAEYQAILQNQPMHFDALMGAGMAWSALGEQDSAMSCFSSGIRHHPRRPEAYVNKGVVEARRGAYLAAADDFRQAIVLDPARRDAWYMLGVALLSAGNRVDACEALGRAQELGHPQAKDLLQQSCRPF